MRLYYCFFMNGAGIKCHDDIDRALRQARQWKMAHPDRHVTVETLDRAKGPHQHPLAVIHVEIPMLVPALTPRHDWEDGYEGTFVVTVGGETRTVEGTYKDALDLRSHMESSPTAVAGIIEKL